MIATYTEPNNNNERNNESIQVEIHYTITRGENVENIQIAPKNYFYHLAKKIEKDTKNLNRDLFM